MKNLLVRLTNNKGVCLTLGVAWFLSLVPFWLITRLGRREERFLDECLEIMKNRWQMVLWISLGEAWVVIFSGGANLGIQGLVLVLGLPIFAFLALTVIFVSLRDLANLIMDDQDMGIPIWM